MLKTTSARILISINITICMGANNGGFDDGNKVGEIGKNLSKGENLSKVNPSEMRFLMLKASIAFIYLKKAFTKAPILYHFDPEQHIQIETNVSRFSIGEIFCQLTSGHVIHTNSDFSTFKIS